jgi:hypothetical protein
MRQTKTSVDVTFADLSADFEHLTAEFKRLRAVVDVVLDCVRDDRAATNTRFWRLAEQQAVLDYVRIARQQGKRLLLRVPSDVTNDGSERSPLPGDRSRRGSG